MISKNGIHKFFQDVRAVAAEIGHMPVDKVEYERGGGKYAAIVTLMFGSWLGVLRAMNLAEQQEKDEQREPKILYLDIETCEMVVKTWQLKTDYIQPGRILKNWAIIAWAAIWVNDPASKIIYKDNRDAKDIRNDYDLLVPLWHLLDEADVIITKNGKRFDQPMIQARMAVTKVMNGKPFSPVKHEDIEETYRRHFRLPSYKLEYIAEIFNTKYKKLKHKKYPGNELWDECEAGNIDAWNEMKKYNCHDVLATREARGVIAPWGATPGVDYNALHGGLDFRCRCGSSSLISRGFNYSKAGKYKKYQCKDCGAWASEKGQANNMWSLKKKMAMKKLGPA